MKEIGRGGVMEQIRLHLGKKPDLVLFRCQSGSVNHGTEKNPRWVKYGLHDGASDLIGCLRVTERAGFGRFFALEVKRPGERPTLEQEAFINLIKSFGGYAGYAESVHDSEIHYTKAGGFYGNSP